MAFEVLESSNGVMTVRVTGELKKSELDRMQAAAVDAIKQWGKIKVLVKVENFRGWERNANWGDVSFIQDEGRNIEKMAIVGDEAWRDLTYAFTGKGFRSTVIEYFTPAERDRALAWLAET